LLASLFRAEEIARRRRSPDRPRANSAAPLVEAIFSEEMRFYPPSLMRRAITHTEFGGHAIKPGVIIIIPIYVVHRHLLWNEPMRFDPARFSAEAKSRCHCCAYMPFGAGPRSCIGSTFAMLEGRAMLAMLRAQDSSCPKLSCPSPSRASPSVSKR
jgi:cytochrome P450